MVSRCREEERFEMSRRSKKILAVAVAAGWVGCYGAEEVTKVEENNQGGDSSNIPGPGNTGGTIAPGGDRPPADRPPADPPPAGRPPADRPPSPGYILATVDCRDAAGAVIAGATCDPVDGLCKDAAGQPIAGVSCVETAVLCLDANGAEVPGAICGADNLCRDNAGNIIEGSCQPVSAPHCPPSNSTSTSTSASTGLSTSTSASMSVSASCSMSASTSVSTEDDADDPNEPDDGA
jgi:hypothetical protein